VDQPEQDFLTRTPMRHVYAADIQLKGVNKAAQNALTLLHSDSREFMVHLDIDVVTAEELPATNVPGNGGLSLAEVQSALSEFASQKNLLGLDIAQYNPEKDSDGSSAKKIVDLLAQALAARLAALAPPSTPATPVTETGDASAASSSSSSAGTAHPASTEVAPESATPHVDSVPSSTSAATETESDVPSTSTANTETNSGTSIPESHSTTTDTD
jgi:hypothetical protein